MKTNDSSSSTAIKVTLPDNVLLTLNEYCDAISQTKSDAIKIAIKQYILMDDKWSNRLFFFKKIMDDIDWVDLNHSLEQPRIGTRIHVATSYEDDPTTARLLKCELIKLDADYVYVRPVEFFRERKPGSSTTSISMHSGTILVPTKVSSSNIAPAIHECEYKIPLSLVWDVNTQDPKYDVDII